MRSVIRPRIVLACGIAPWRVRTVRIVRTPQDGEDGGRALLLPLALEQSLQFIERWRNARPSSVPPRVEGFARPTD
jgi:hypothetical protein